MKDGKKFGKEKGVGTGPDLRPQSLPVHGSDSVRPVSRLFQFLIRPRYDRVSGHEYGYDKDENCGPPGGPLGWGWRRGRYKGECDFEGRRDL